MNDVYRYLFFQFKDGDEFRQINPSQTLMKSLGIVKMNHRYKSYSTNLLLGFDEVDWVYL